MGLGRTYRSRVVGAGLLLGVLIGLVAAEAMARSYRLREGRRRLEDYAQRVMGNAMLVSREGEETVNAVLNDGLVLCSPEEIRLMRGIVYNSLEVRDIGRIRNGAFVCSSEVGAMEPFAMPAPARSFRNMTIYGWKPVMFGTGNQGFIVQVRDVDIVLNQRSFDAVKDATDTFAAYLYDSQTRTLIQGFGTSMPLTDEEIIAALPIQRNGIHYRPLCSAKSRVCVVVAESEATMLAANESFHRVLLVAGASIGETLALAFFLLYQRHRSQAAQLRRAVRRRELGVVYQPIVNLSSGEVIGLEALVRWTNEDNEIVPPDVFIAIAEERLFVTEITRLVVHTCLRELGDELRAKAVRLTINITDQDLSDPAFLPFLHQALLEAGVDAPQLGLELTERSATNQPAAIETVARLRHAGHLVYLDDFGTGYSSLAYLADLDVDAIKIDRAFTASIGTNSLAEFILPQVMQMALQLQLSVVAEGIETAEQAQYFEQQHGGTLGQGWLFGKPMPASQARDRLKHPVESAWSRAEHTSI